MPDAISQLSAAAARDPELRALLKNADNPDVVVLAAADLGIILTHAEVLAQVQAELGDASLDQVTGGINGLPSGYLGQAQSQAILFANMVNQQAQYSGLPPS